jgi:hypothetical protein
MTMNENVINTNRHITDKFLKNILIRGDIHRCFIIVASLKYVTFHTLLGQFSALKQHLGGENR